ncbi:MAG: amidohydrolase family protein [Firmicutes bacterium]|nr:amidohydrolase family protein [Bacillota bacterium]
MIVDLHHHWMPRRHYEELERYLGPEFRVERHGERAYVFRGEEQYFMPTPTYFHLSQQIADMDAAGVDMAVLHVGLWQDWNTSVTFAREINEELAAVQQQYPHRFVGLVHPPVHDPEAGAAEVERGIRELGLRGVALNAHFRGLALDHRHFWPIFAAADRLDVPIVVHPASVPPHTEWMADYQLSNGLGRALDLTVVTVRLFYSGVFEAFPRLRFSMSHLGGAFFALKNRVAPQFFARTLPAPGKRAELPAADFDRDRSRIYFDTAPALWSSDELILAAKTVGAEQIVFGSDYPIGPRWMQDAHERLRSLRPEVGLDPHRLGANAERLFGRPLR